MLPHRGDTRGRRAPRFGLSRCSMRQGWRGATPLFGGLGEDERPIPSYVVDGLDDRFIGNSNPRAAASTLDRPPPWPRRVDPPETPALIESCFAKDAGQRRTMCTGFRGADARELRKRVDRARIVSRQERDHRSCSIAAEALQKARARPGPPRITLRSNTWRARPSVNSSSVESTASGDVPCLQ